jgi:hypothetical protein
MFFKIVPATILLLVMSASASIGQTNCDDQLINYQQWKETADTKWNLALIAGNGGQLNYYGARHTDQPGDAQFAEIKKLWEQSKPSIAFFEGPNRGIAASDTGTISRFGESGYVRFLANQAGIKSLSLEPPPASLYQYLVSKYPQEKVDLYFLLSEAMRLRTRKEYTKEQISKELSGMLEKMPAMLGVTTSIKSISDLETAFRKYWGTQTEWWQASSDWFDPNKEAADTGGIFTNEINKLSSQYRNVYMYKLLAEHVNKGEKVLAVVGRNHVPVQEPALKCAIK